MGSSTQAGLRLSRVSDDELLRRIGNDLRSLYTEIIRRPLPPNIEAALARIDRMQHHSGNLRRPTRWTASPLGF